MSGLHIVVYVGDSVGVTASKLLLVHNLYVCVCVLIHVYHGALHFFCLPGMGLKVRFT